MQRLKHNSKQRAVQRQKKTKKHNVLHKKEGTKGGEASSPFRGGPTVGVKRKRKKSTERNVGSNFSASVEA
jgi:hypothetical protein